MGELWSYGLICGAQVSGRRGGVQAFVPRVRTPGREVVRTAAEVLCRGWGGAGEDATGTVCPSYTDAYT